MLRVGGIGGVLGGGAALSVVDGAGVGAASVAVSSTLTGGRSARAMPKHPSARTVILRCISCHVSRPGLALARLLVPMLVRA